jgi:lipopolysaccharide biosynthesis glycosyltransferase
MTAPQRHDCAVAFCVDRKFLLPALFQIWQIAHLNPHRRFDFVITSEEDLSVPDWARHYGIVLHRVGALHPDAEKARYRGSLSTIYRLMLARELGDRYRRIIYMDSDMFIEGGDLNRLMEIDLGPHPLAAVLDLYFFYQANHRAEEFILAGLPAMPYFNSGFQVIDTRAYCEQEVELRSMASCRIYPQAIVTSEQSMMNLALQGRFAQLQPCWNWQIGKSHPMLLHNYPVFVHHFIGRRKPNLDADEPWPVRFNQAYRDFMAQHAPEALASLAPLRAPKPLSFRDAARFLVSHTMASHVFESAMARHTDPYRAIL